MEEFDLADLSADDILISQGSPENPIEIDLGGSTDNTHTISDLTTTHNARSYYKLINLPTVAYNVDAEISSEGRGVSRFNLVLYTDPEFSDVETTAMLADELSPTTTGLSNSYLSELYGSPITAREFILENHYWTNKLWEQPASSGSNSAVYMWVTPLGGEAGITFDLKVSPP